MTPSEIYQGESVGKLSGAFMVLEEARRDLEAKWENGETLLTGGQIKSYREAEGELENRLRDIMLIVAKFEKLNTLRKELSTLEKHE